MVADSDSAIAWHRVQVKKHCEALRHIETAKFTFGEIANSKMIGPPQKAIVELKRKIKNSEQIIAAYERQSCRPLTTDHQTLATARWSDWNPNQSSNAVARSSVQKRPQEPAPARTGSSARDR
jgi:hypothetical protein